MSKKYESYHDDGCTAKLNPDGFCPKCGFYPDMQSIALKESKNEINSKRQPNRKKDSLIR